MTRVITQKFSPYQEQHDAKTESYCYTGTAEVKEERQGLFVTSCLRWTYDVIKLKMPFLTYFNS